ncbi:MAG: helix-turn-helix domain-containing protein [Kiritimatiellae bacterium]|nr:helix-turn-helix domain-containing protein [Kiritimatiellia bacterium]
MPEARLPRLVGMGSREDARSVRFHRHPGVELIYVNKGLCRTRIQGSEEVLEGRPGWLYVIPAGALHDQRRMTVSRTTYLVLDTAQVRIQAWPRLLYLGPESHEARWLCDVYELARTAPASDDMAGGLLLALLRRLETRIEQRDDAPRVPQPVATAISLVRDNIDSELTVAQVGKAGGLSASRMAALFKQHCGCGIIAYQQQLRLDRARRLLQDPYLRVSEVARACGYADVNYFIRLFRQRHGAAPNRWRKRH